MDRKCQDNGVFNHLPEGKEDDCTYIWGFLTPLFFSQNTKSDTEGNCGRHWEFFNTFHRYPKAPGYHTSLSYLFIGKEHQSTSAYESAEVYGKNNPQLLSNTEVRQALGTVSTFCITGTVTAQILSVQSDCDASYPGRVNTENTWWDPMLERSTTGIKTTSTVASSTTEHYQLQACPVSCVAFSSSHKVIKIITEWCIMLQILCLFWCAHS